MDLMEVLVGQMRRSKDLVDVMNLILSDGLILSQKHDFCVEIVALARRTIVMMSTTVCCYTYSGLTVFHLVLWSSPMTLWTTAIVFLIPKIRCPLKLQNIPVSFGSIVIYVYSSLTI